MSFLPSDYFEEPINTSRLDCNMSITDGKMVAELDSAVDDINSLMRKELHDALIGRFREVQLLTHRPYKLAKPTIAHVYPSGRRDIVVELGSQAITSSTSSLDSQLTDKH